MFALVSDEVRTTCSFDSHAFGRNTAASYFWVFAFPSPPGESTKLIGVDTDQKITQLPRQVAGSPYENWLKPLLYARDFDRIGAGRSIAGEMQKLLLGQTYQRELLQATPAAIAQQFIEVNWSFIVTALEEKLEKILGPRLGSRVLHPVLTDLKNPETGSLVPALMDGIPVDLLLRKLSRLFWRQKPSQEELLEMERFLLRNKNAAMDALLLYWKQDYRALSRYLNSLATDLYRQSIERLLQEDKVQRKKLMSQERLTVFLDTFIMQTGNNPDLLREVPELVDALIRMKQESELVRISPLLCELTARELAAVEKTVKEARSGRLPVDFVRALEGAMSARAKEEQAQSSSGGFFGGLMRRLGPKDRNG